MNHCLDSNYSQSGGGNVQNANLDLKKSISYALPLKKIQSVRSSIIKDKRVRSYGKICTDFLDRTKTKAEQLRLELYENDIVMANNVVLGVDSLSSRDERMSSSSSDDQIKADVNMSSDAENENQDKVYKEIVTSTCLDPSPLKNKTVPEVIANTISNESPDNNAFSLTFSGNQASTLASTMLKQGMQQAPKLTAQSSIVSSSAIPSSNIRINGRRLNLSQYIAKSSVNYFILSFLPPQQILRLGRLNRRFYDLYVPVTLSTVTIGGTIPVN